MTSTKRVLNDDDDGDDDDSRLAIYIYGINFFFNKGV